MEQVNLVPQVLIVKGTASEVLVSGQELGNMQPLLNLGPNPKSPCPVLGPTPQGLLGGICSRLTRSSAPSRLGGCSCMLWGSEGPVFQYQEVCSCIATEANTCTPTFRSRCPHRLELPRWCCGKESEMEETQETWVPSLGQKILGRKWQTTPVTEKPGGL